MNKAVIVLDTTKDTVRPSVLMQSAGCPRIAQRLQSGHGDMAGGPLKVTDEGTNVEIISTDAVIEAN